MIAALLYAALCVVAVCMIVTARIPEGWEDDEGYHEVKNPRKEDEKSC